MKFSICIPNYNYERYLGRTIQSVLDQQGADFEILVSDNCSTDKSVAIVEGFNDSRIKLRINACNVGFAGNLDRAARLATGEAMIMLSSDDLMRAGALSTYQRFWEHLGAKANRTIATASWEWIDAEDRVTSDPGPDLTLWTERDRQPELEQLLDAKVYGVPAEEMLRRCLLQMKNPFNFAATVYAAELYQRVEGYGGGRLINPDKWFHWKVLGAADMAYYIDKPLFAYRWHASNQDAQQSAAGALKYMVDEYVSTLEVDAKVLERIGLSREALARSFVENDIARHGLSTLAGGGRSKARRILTFGRAVYPQYVRTNRKAWALAMLLALGPVGQHIAHRAHKSYSRSRNDGRSDRRQNAPDRTKS
jgi:glycosyltransferase involved in cell wall biosynthesis